jgi:hypothetical protein
MNMKTASGLFLLLLALFIATLGGIYARDEMLHWLLMDNESSPLRVRGLLARYSIYLIVILLIFTMRVRQLFTWIAIMSGLGLIAVPVVALVNVQLDLNVYWGSGTSEADVLFGFIVFAVAYEILFSMAIAFIGHRMLVKSLKSA